MSEPGAAPPDPRVGVVAQLACLLEASAPKPGNVTPAEGFGDVRFEHFLASAAAVGPEMALAGTRGVGTTILAARRATGVWVRPNTNLGIVLLLAPLARAAALGGPLREGVQRVLAALDAADAVDAYRAIREADPGGLGEAPEQDVREEPSVGLREAMSLAAGRDSIAAEYATGYRITFERTVPVLRRARDAGAAWPQATLTAYLEVLAAVPDTLVARRLGEEEAEAVSRLAERALELGGAETEPGRGFLARMDRKLRRDANARNPGTTADLVAAGLFVELWEAGGPL